MERMIKLFKENFDCKLNYKPISLELGLAHAFFVEIEDLDLSTAWKIMRNLIALEFQNKLSNEFERWNIYLFYIVKKPITRDLKYIIENDTFSSRKIVIVEGIEYTKIIEEYIMNCDLNIDDKSISIGAFIPNSIISDEIENLEVKARVSNPIKEAHSRIVSKLKEVYNEV